MNHAIAYTANMQPQTMSSREIAELTGKRHDHVMVDCRKLAQFYIETYSPEISGEHVKPSFYKDSTGRDLPCFDLCKQASLDLVTGYSLPHRHAVNVRWQELENEKAQGIIALPNFTDPAEAAMAWAGEYRAKQLAIVERDHAIRTKAEIGNRREATAMATASKYRRENDDLKDRLGESVDYASVKAVTITTRAATEYNWRPLKKWSVEHDTPINEVHDPNFGKVKAYHKDAWQAVFGIDLYALFGIAGSLPA